VYSNNPQDHNGGFPAFDDSSTIATWLQDAGYRTGLFGKYLNGYDTEYVPPGWDRWFATHESGAYYDYGVTSDGVIESYGRARRDYGTTVLGDEATGFIRGTPAEAPLFAYISVPAPHAPFVAAQEDRTAFSELRPWRPPSYNEKVISDKPRYLRELPWLDGERRREIDAIRLRQLRTLPAVDRLVGEVIGALEETGRLNNTIIAFTSDNGMLWGEHRWDSKEVPYEESIAVPMLIRYDALGLTARRDRHLVLNVDLAPTFAAAAGIVPPDVEGANLLPLLRDPSVAWRDGFLFEHMSTRALGVPSYCGWHTGDHVLIRYSGRQSELYDLRADPWQLGDRPEDLASEDIWTSLNEQLVVSCRPPPPALILT
jgi:arylsulfatase A-like enzyme